MFMFWFLEVVEGIDADSVAGIGFDATCSLVALDNEDKPITVSPTGEHEQNVIMWMDQRAVQETEVINALNHSAFQYVGGKVSIEMQLPKLLWLKRNLCDTWYQTKRFMDLSDFLTWKATNSDARSLCSVICKWNYIVDESGCHG
ncbi:FGGY carbohydrate kinase domain-containing protein-like [Daphnia pulicaria]|uniref:FGGY carbohydrate kinase domain-containing protein-like n=1 Tax=Daphnia pulicaria TaxID=35523 RepID=UPI001EE9D577|nr:FGGY carbohydrate kinase domain-containing protein-like [Daphnia pulicaria]